MRLFPLAGRSVSPYTRVWILPARASRPVSVVNPQMPTGTTDSTVPSLCARSRRADHGGQNGPGARHRVGTVPRIATITGGHLRSDRTPRLGTG